MKFLTRSLLIATALVAPATMASAATSIVTSSFGPTKTETTFSGSLAGFDTSLGTLSSVVLTYTFGADFSGTVTNTAAQAQTFKVSESVDGTFDFSGSYTGSGDLTPSKTQTFTMLGAGQSAAFGPVTAASDAVSASQTFTGDLSSFVNSLNYNVSTLTGQQFLGGGGNTAADIATKASGTVSIQYNYDVAAVPEPASWAMMVGGFGMLGGALRRKRGTTAVTFG